MLHQLAIFYAEQSEPNQGFMLGLRQIILNYDASVTEHWKWKIPFFYYRNKPFCYIWRDAKTNNPYLGIVKAAHIENKHLIKGNRKTMKIFPFDPNKDIPVDDIYEIFEMLKPLYHA